MIEFLSAFWDIFIYPVSVSIDFNNPVYYVAYTILVCGGLAALARRLTAIGR